MDGWMRWDEMKKKMDLGWWERDGLVGKNDLEFLSYLTYKTPAHVHLLFFGTFALVYYVPCTPLHTPSPSIVCSMMMIFYISILYLCLFYADGLPTTSTQ
ncbi:hypothetical protein BDF14DRAFT_1835865 [Spinellus fusiger]|nr:hypothetical protein BDF14DRAFT_1835865 [Spinellus fusiger]